MKILLDISMNNNKCILKGVEYLSNGRIRMKKWNRTRQDKITNININKTRVESVQLGKTLDLNLYGELWRICCFLG